MFIYNFLYEHYENSVTGGQMFWWTSQKLLMRFQRQKMSTFIILIPYVKKKENSETERYNNTL